MVHSIVKAKTTPDAEDDFFVTYDHDHAVDLILTLVESGWVFVEQRRIVRRDPVLEQTLENCNIGSPLEWRCLKKYFEMQNTHEKEKDA